MKSLKALLIFMLASGSLFAQQSKMLNFQGALYDEGIPVNDTVSVEFTIYLDDTTWVETHSGVGVTQGYYSVVLGSVDPDNHPFPSWMFYNAAERDMDIAVTYQGNVTDLGMVTLYAPLRGDNPNLLAGNVRIEGGGFNALSIEGPDSSLNIFASPNWQTGGEDWVNRGGLWLLNGKAEQEERGINDRVIDILVSDDGHGGSVGEMRMKGPHGGSGENHVLVEMKGITDNGTDHFGRIALFFSNDSTHEERVSFDGNGGGWFAGDVHIQGNLYVDGEAPGGGGGGDQVANSFGIDAARVQWDDGDGPYYPRVASLERHEWQNEQGEDLDIGVLQLWDTDGQHLFMTAKGMNAPKFNMDFENGGLWFNAKRFTQNDGDGDYYPSLVEISVHEWNDDSANATEDVAHINLRSTTGEDLWISPYNISSPRTWIDFHNGTVGINAKRFTQNDGDGDYYPTLIDMSVHEWDDEGTPTEDVAHLTLRTTAGRELSMSPYGISGLTDVGLDARRVQWDDGNGPYYPRMVGLEVHEWDDEGDDLDVGILQLWGTDTTNLFLSPHGLNSQKLSFDFLNGGIGGLSDVGLDARRVQWDDGDGPYFPRLVGLEVHEWDDNGDDLDVGILQLWGTDTTNLFISPHGINSAKMNIDFLNGGIGGLSDIGLDARRIQWDDGDGPYFPRMVGLEVHEWNENSTDFDVGVLQLWGTDTTNVVISPHGLNSQGLNMDFRHGNLQMNGVRGLGNDPLIELGIHEWGDPDTDVAHLSLRSSDGASMDFNAYGSQIGNWDQGVFYDNQSINFHRGGDGSGNGVTAVSINSFDDGGSNVWGEIELHNINASDTFRTVKINGNEGRITLTSPFYGVDLLNLDGRDGSALFGGGVQFNQTLHILGSTTIGYFGQSIQSDNQSINFYRGASGNNDGAMVVSMNSFGDSSDVVYGALELYRANTVDTVRNIALMANTGEIQADSISVTSVNTVNAPNVTSDERFKTNVANIENPVEKVNALNGVTYNWNALAQQVKGISDETEQVGVLAQEVEAVLPQLVTTDANGYKSVNYSALTALLIESIKELNKEVETLKNENTTLKAEVKSVDQLEARLAKLEKLLGVDLSEESSANNK